MYLNYRQDMIVILVLGFFFFFTGMYIMHLKLQANISSRLNFSGCNLCTPVIHIPMVFFSVYGVIF